MRAPPTAMWEEGGIVPVGLVCTCTLEGVTGVRSLPGLTVGLWHCAAVAVCAMMGSVGKYSQLFNIYWGGICEGEIPSTLEHQSPILTSKTHKSSP